MKSVVTCQDSNPICAYHGEKTFCEYDGFCEFQRPRDCRKLVEFGD
jgi:hypothetical protein